MIPGPCRILPYWSGALDFDSRGSDLKLHREVRGEGNDLVLVHGRSSNASTWDPLLPHLAGFRVHLVELLGHGSSPSPDRREAFSIDHQLTCLEETLEDLSEPFFFVGHSMGGFLGVRYALRNPGRLAGLVLESTAADNPFQTGFQRAGAFLEKQAQLAEAEGMEAVCRLLESQGELHPRQRQNLLEHTPLAYAETLHAIGRMDRVAHRLGEVRCPTLVVCGYLDEFFVDSSKVLAEKIPGARSCFLTEVGHSPHRDATGAVAEVLGSFLREYARPPRGVLRG